MTRSSCKSCSSCQKEARQAAPKETMARGPLKLEMNEVTCYGTTLTFNGKEVVKMAVK